MAGARPTRAGCIYQARIVAGMAAKMFGEVWSTSLNQDPPGSAAQSGSEMNRSGSLRTYLSLNSFFSDFNQEWSLHVSERFKRPF